MTVAARHQKADFRIESCIVEEAHVEGGRERREQEHPPPETLTAPEATKLTPNQIRVLFILMGMGTLFPYNTLITCVDYFAMLHPHARDVATQLAASCISALLVTTVLLLPFSHSPHTADGTDYSLTCNGVNFLGSATKRILAGYAFVFVLLLIIAIIPSPSMLTLNLLSYLVGTADALAQSGLYVFAASYHIPAYSAAVTFGSAVAGLAVSFLRLVTRGFFETDTVQGLRKSTALLFVLSAGVLGQCMWALLVTARDRQGLAGDDNFASTEGELGLAQSRGNVEITDRGHKIDLTYEMSHTRAGSEHDVSPVMATRDEKLQKEAGSLNSAGGDTDECNGADADAFGSETGGVARTWEEHVHHRQDTEAHHRKHGKKIITSGSARGAPQATFPTTSQQDLGLPSHAICYDAVKSGVATIQDDAVVGHHHHANFCHRVTHSPRLALLVETIRITWKPTFSTFFNFFVTLSLFPGTVTSIKSFPSSGLGVHFDDWLPVVLISIFNLADCGGRAILGMESCGAARRLLVRLDDVTVRTDQDETSDTPPGRSLLPNYDRMVWWQTLLRVLFYPIIAACVVPVTPHPIIASDLLRCLVVFIFGLTNGFVTCANFMVTPTMVHGEKYRDASSLILVLALYLGLTSGVYFGFVVDSVLESVVADDKG